MLSIVTQGRSVEEMTGEGDGAEKRGVKEGMRAETVASEGEVVEEEEKEVEEEEKEGERGGAWDRGVLMPNSIP